MSASAKMLVIAEIVVCFGPVMVLFVIGLALLPMQMYFLIADPNISSLLFVCWCLGGGLGLLGLFSVVGDIFAKPGMMVRLTTTLVMCLAGIGALVPFVLALSEGPLALRVAAVLPVAAAIHILFVWRQILNGAQQN